MTKTILVTGVAGYWGGQIAAALLAKPGLHVIGLDSTQPKTELKDLDFIQADIRNPLLTELLQAEGVEAVCHAAFIESRYPNEAAFDFNVMGTVKVFGACSAAGVAKIVFPSSTAVYGALPQNPMYLTESRELKGCPTWGTVRDLVEIESFCNGFRRQAPGITLTVLRFPSIIGPTADTPLTRFLKEPLAPVLMGFDPLMQLIHEQDVVGAVLHAFEYDASGVFNVAAEGVVPLIKLARLAGKTPLPVFHLFAYWGSNLAGGLKDQAEKVNPIEWDYLRYPWVADLERMSAVLEFAPRYTTEEALREFAGIQRMRVYKPESASLDYDAERLRDTIERRKRIRSQRPGFDVPPLDEDEEMEGVL